MYQDLMAQAEQLARMDVGRPKQASLRRAVSTAYYAVFHYLVEEACCVQIGTQNAQRAYRHALGRAFVHATMNECCSSFGGGTLKNAVIKGMPRGASGNYVIPKAIQNLAATFAELQEKRHLADYDRSEYFKRSEVLTLIDQAQSHVQAFSQLPPTDDRKFFLACLWAWKELTRR